MTVAIKLTDEEKTPGAKGQRMRHLIVSVTLVFAGCTAPSDISVTPAARAETNRPVRVFIVAGQSNAVGYNNVTEYQKGKVEFPKELRYQPRIMFWQAGSDGREQTNAWRTLRVADSGSFGPEISFACDMAQAMPNERIAIVKCAVGATGIARSVDYDDYIPALHGFDDKNNNWHPPSQGRKSGALYERLIRDVRAATSALDRENRAWQLTGAIWMQGEHEAGISRKMAEDYGDLLAGFVGAVRRDLEASALPFAIGQINSHAWAYGDVARESQARACRNDSRAVLVATVDLSRSGSGGAAHFDADGMVTLGSRFAEAMQSQLAPKKSICGNRTEGD